MRTRMILIAVLVLGTVTFGFTGDNWPHWRGPTANGVSDETDLPLRWGTEENIHWKLDLPGRSGATPIIWGDHVFVNISDGDSIELWAVNRKSGDVMWKKVLGRREPPDTKTQPRDAFTGYRWRERVGHDRHRSPAPTRFRR